MEATMMEIDRHQILMTLDEKVDPAHAAVIVVDMQKDFTMPRGYADEIGIDVGPIGELAERLGSFLDAARRCGVPIYHVMANYDAQYMSAPMHERLLRHGQRRYCQSGSWGIEFHQGLEPRSGEPVVVKHRYDAFHDTELDILLQARGIRTVIMCGVTAHACVDSSTRHAYFLGYYTVFGADLTGGAPSREAHQVTLDSMNALFGVTATADEIVAAWERVAAAAGAADVSTSAA
jgi:nicotinamidase-related amidase